jgi:hypothetical protein
MSIILKYIFIIQDNFDKAQALRGVMNAGVGINLIIVDIPEGLHVSMVSSLAISVPEWNKLRDGFLQTVFDFASSLVHGDRVLLVFHSDDLQMRVDIKGFMKAYHFSLFKEFMGINHLQMISCRDTSKIVNEPCFFQIY